MDDWRDHIPEGVERSHFDRFDDLGGVLKSYAEDKSEIGRRVRVPTEDSTPEEVAKFYKHLGTPESPDGYKPVETEDQGLKELMSNFVGSAHKANLTTRQFDALQESLVQTYADLSEKGVQAIQEAQAQQRSEWAEQARANLGDRFDSVLGQAKEAVNKLLSEDHLEALRETGLTDHPAMVQMFGEVLYPMIADGMVPSDKAASQAADSKKVAHIKGYHEARAKALKLQSDDPGQRSPEIQMELKKMSQHREALVDLGLRGPVPDLEPEELIS